MEKRILIVDDTFANRFLITEILKANTDILYKQASNGKEAIIKINEFKPNIIFLDIEMPVMNGYEVLEYIRNNSELKKTIVIAITAHIKENLKIDKNTSGFNSVISKPYIPEKILEIINSYC